MANNYIEVVEFTDFKKNQETLIGILNHNMTKISTDVEWIKSSMKWFLSIGAGIFISVCAAIIVALMKTI